MNKLAASPFQGSDDGMVSRSDGIGAQGKCLLVVGEQEVALLVTAHVLGEQRGVDVMHHKLALGMDRVRAKVRQVLVESSGFLLDWALPAVKFGRSAAKSVSHDLDRDVAVCIDEQASWALAIVCENMSITLEVRVFKEFPGSYKRL